MPNLIERLAHLPDEKRKLTLSEMAEHLVDGGKSSKLVDLLLSNNEWLEAKAFYLKTDSSYLHDLQLLGSQFNDPLSPDQMPTLSSLIAAQQIVGQRADAYNDFDLQTLIWLNREDEALAAARLRADPKARFDGLLSAHAAIKSRRGSGSGLLQEICDLVKEITFIEDKASALRALAVGCAEEQDPRAFAFFDDAIQAALSINDILRSPNELFKLANALIHFKYFDKARHVSLSIQDHPIWRDRALNALSDALSNEGRHADAAAIKSLLAPEARTIGARPQTPSPTQGQTIITTVSGENLTAEAPGDDFQAIQLDAAVDKALESGLFEEALTTARSIPISRRQVRALSRISTELAKAGNEQAAGLLVESREVALAAENLPARLTVLGRLSAVVEDPQCAGEVLQIARKLANGIAKPLNRALALLELANILLLTQDEQAQRLIDEAWNIVVEAPPSRDRDSGLDQVVRTLTRANRVSEAESAIGSMIYDFNRANALTSIGHILVEQGDPQAVAILEKARHETDSLVPYGIGPMNDEEEPALALSHLAGVLALAGERDVDDYFDRAYAAVGATRDRYSQSIAWTALVESLLKAGRRKEAEVLGGDSLIYEMESSIYSYEIEALIREKRVEEAVQIARNIQEDQYRRHSLAMIAEQLVHDGCPAQGLSILGPRTVDEFLAVLANYRWPSDKALFREVLAECIRIAAWVIPFWKQIDQTLSTLR